MYVKKIMFGILLHVIGNCENRKYLAYIKDDSVMMCDKMIESYDEGADA